MITKNYDVIEMVAPHVRSSNLLSFASYIVNIYDVNGRATDLVIALTSNEIDNTPDPNIIFRGNSVATKSVDYFMKVAGSVYRANVIAPIITDICQQKKTTSLEIDPTKMDKNQDAKKNADKLKNLCQSLLDRIYQSTNECPE